MIASPQHDLEKIIALLEQAYIVIWHKQMQDVPIVNSELQVKALDFQVWQNFYLGVLVTPWFMNLVLLPQDQAEWSHRGTGEKFIYAFNAGEFEFILGQIEGFGPLLTCSLFSPMFEFENQAAAVATGQAVMLAIFNENNQDSDTAQSWEPIVADEAEPQLTVRTEALSRRDFFRGNFFATTSDTHKAQP